ncbi:DNA polymerase III subunit gamma/tau [Defluviimonas aquaemixtae]|uniref:DNA polymerase III subunit gamma/tau n=1 Tax=Albidovulum aquaemixtae TaxID=1542388 RepID=A0A2R8BKY2_9RHOB|nr:DNA polymerase III subunit delta' [Defluviimonas aquaemixtae]SPH24014.1 DNA polymerase III subunit gamma/tau [Defluviimonas aquaemixtae]
MTDDALPEPDRVEGAPHPRDTGRLIGQATAEAAFLDAHAGGRLHHAWLLTGPFGVGKATLAWRVARFLLATKADDGEGGLFADAGPPPAPQSLDIDAGHPVARRIHAGAEPRLFLLRRAWDEDRKRLKTVITVDEVRKLRSFLQLSAADGGHRVVIVDAADEMNIAAANALLKMLEEPPAGVTFLLVSHQPSRLLPTIRSRCRALKLGTLASSDLVEAMRQAGAELGDGEALSALSGGSVGEAIRLVNLDGIETYAAIVDLIRSVPRLDRPRALKLAEAAARRGAEERLDLLLSLIDLFLARLARRGALGAAGSEAAPGETELLARLAPDPVAGRRWAELQQTLGARARHGRAVNLDPATLILDVILKIDETARELVSA